MYLLRDTTTQLPLQKVGTLVTRETIRAGEMGVAESDLRSVHGKALDLQIG